VKLTTFGEARVSEIMVKKPVTTVPETRVIDVAKTMKNNSIGSVIIVVKNKAVGIVTERDLVSRVVAMGRDPSDLEVKDIMSKPPIVVFEETTLTDAINVMKGKKIRRLIVVDEGDKVVGILTIDDIGYNIDRFTEKVGLRYYLMTQKIREREKERAPV
jgi:CBS domain-containing protein